jgi:PleD family two-component response regulator
MPSYFSGKSPRTSPLAPSVVSSPSEIYGFSTSVEVPDASKRVRVLVADDNSINLQIMQRRLEKMGHSVRISWDGQECFELFKEHHSVVDFILMDLDVSSSPPFFKPSIPLTLTFGSVEPI